MGKRNSAIVLSSDDDDDNGGEAFSSPVASDRRSYSKTRSISRSSRPFVTRTNPGPSKKPRRSRLSRESRDLDQVGFPCEDFEELFSRSKVSAGSGRGSLKELWVEKYKPRSLEELAVHKKKVEEVQVWFEERLRPLKENNFLNQVLVITGQAGVGKSATIHVIASHFGARLCEWNAPTPTVWQEHMHNANTGINYTSKLDEFINFIERIRKYGLISSSSYVESRQPVILLIDDLPVTNGRVGFDRLRDCLLLLVRSTRVPTAILITDYGKADSADYSARCLEELQLALESVGACKVAFNPITTNSIKKILTGINRQEDCNVTIEQIDMIAKASEGDIRHAVTSLQLFCVIPDPVLNLSNGTRSYSERKSDEISDLVTGFSFLFGRDETLSLFHALGKFLHNKRETEVSMSSDQDSFLVREKFYRFPLKMDTPEKVLCQTHGQARPIADFLHENVLEFIDDEAIDDSWDVASYLSDADLLLSSFRGILVRYNEAEGVLQSAAASIAVRGVLYGNSHPSASRWHSIRRPKLWQVEQSMLRNQKEMVRNRFTACSGSSFSNVLDIATEYTPVLKWLGCRASCEENGDLMQSDETSNNMFERMQADDEWSKSSEDEIEDC